MKQEILASLLYDILSFLQQNRDVFLISSHEKEQRVRLFGLPSQYSAYFSQYSEQEVFEDIQHLMRYLNGSQTQNIARILSPFVFFLTHDYTASIDLQSPLSIQGKTQTILSTLARKTTYTINQHIQECIQCVQPSLFVCVQTPRKISGDLQQEIRTSLLAKHPMHFARFSINKNLIGGIRILVDGSTTDLSWIGTINRIINLT